MTIFRSSSFDPETIATIKAVLDAAISTLAIQHRTPSANVAIASRLLAAAAEGHRSKEILSAVAAQEVGKYRDGYAVTAPTN
jgi:hypothetical protein